MQPGVIDDLLADQTLDWLAAERESMGFDHCEVGAMVADHFNLGPALRAVIEHQHVPTMARAEHRVLVNIVHVADAARAMMAGDAGADDLSDLVGAPVLEALGIGHSELAEIICDALTESNKLLEVIGPE